eukprot:Colp12_sorted_trinity150504_noHs@33275
MAQGWVPTRALLMAAILAILVNHVQAQSKTCATLHCGMQMMACAAEKGCRQTLECSTKCGTDESCQVSCTEAYADDKFDVLAKCLVVNKCMQPTPAEICPPPTMTSQTFNPDTDLQGFWYTISGLSKIYDTFACQRYNMTNEAPGRWNYIWNFRTTLNAVDKQHQTHCLITMPDSSNPTELFVDYTEHGVTGRDHWYIISASQKHLVIYYCGSSDMAQGYQGGVVLSRSNQMDDETFETAKKEAAAAGVDLEKFTVIDQERCVY